MSTLDYIWLFWLTCFILNVCATIYGICRGGAQRVLDESENDVKVFMLVVIFPLAPIATVAVTTYFVIDLFKQAITWRRNRASNRAAVAIAAVNSATSSSTRAMQEFGRVLRGSAPQPKPKPKEQRQKPPPAPPDDAMRFAQLPDGAKFVFWSPYEGRRNRPRFMKVGVVSYVSLDSEEFDTKKLELKSSKVLVLRLSQNSKNNEADRWDDI